MNQIKKLQDLGRRIDELGKADIHIHSKFSDGKNTIAQILDYVEKKTDLNVIAITDHDTIEGAILAQKIAKEKKYRFEVIIGEEISTQKGHLIGLFLQERIKKGMTVRETIEAIKKQNGLVIAPHPLHHSRMKSGSPLLMDGIGILSILSEKHFIDGIECFNSTFALLGKSNLKAKLINNSLIMKSDIGSSDAHMLDLIGTGMTLFEGKTAFDLRIAINDGQTVSMSNRKSLISILKYGFFFLPRGMRIFIYTLIHGRSKKRTQISNVGELLAQRDEIRSEM